MQAWPLFLLSAAVAAGLLLATCVPARTTAAEGRPLSFPLSLLALAASTTALVVPGHSAALDNRLLSLIGEHTTTWLNTLMAGITHTGSAWSLTLLMSACVIWQLHNRNYPHALLLALSGLSAGLLVIVSKALIARPRPELWDIIEVSSYSFPSGHSLGTAACAGALAIVAMRRAPQRRRVWITGAVTWSALVGLSRMALGVHWPTDVLAGLLIGFAIPLLLSRLPGCRQPD